MLKILVPIIALAAGGFYFYRRNHQTEEDLETDIDYALETTAAE